MAIAVQIATQGLWLANSVPAVNVEILLGALPAEAGCALESAAIINAATVRANRKVRGTLVDAAQAQAVAKGISNQPPSLAPSAYNEAVVSFINSLHRWRVRSVVMR